jgi:hypothetical protein
MINHHTPGDQVRGLLGLLGIWTSWLVGSLPAIQQGIQILASVAALAASIIYARYYWMKTKQEKGK